MKQTTAKLILSALAFSLATPFPVSADEVTAEDVMAKVLLDNAVGSDIKQENAFVLLSTEAGCQRLVDILGQQGYNDTRKVICLAISRYNPGGLFASSKNLPVTFLEPLFKCLYSEDQSLSDAAAAALAVAFPDTALPRLAGTAVSADLETPYRLAAIAAIERFSGREALLDLAELLQDPQPQIRERAIDAVCRRMVIDRDKFDIKKFIDVELPNLRWMSDVDFLLHQARRLSMNNKLLNSEVENTQQQVLYWQAKYLRAETDRFNSLAPENKLTMLQNRLEPQQDKPIRQWAASQLVTWGNSATAREGIVAEGVVKLLGDYVSDSEDFVRSSVAEALGVFGYKSDSGQLIQKLLEQLKVEESFPCQRSMLNTLGQLQYAPALEQCVLIWENSGSDEIAAAAISAAGKMSGKLTADDSGRIELLVRSITDNFNRASDQPALKVAVYQAIRKIIETERWRKLSSESFGDLIDAGLKDELADVRAMSVHACVALSGSSSVSTILDMDLLNDSEAAVRFAVITAVDSSGSPEFLARLKDRFIVESSSDVKGRLQEAIRKILASMPVNDVYNWGLSLAGADEAVRVLKTQVAAILVDKVAAMKTESLTVEPKYEILILGYNIEDYLKKQQYEQAGRTIVDLLNYEMTPSERLGVCAELFDIVFDGDIDFAVRQRVVDLAQVVIPGLFQKYPEVATAFEERYDVMSNGVSGNILFKARLVKQFLMPAELSFSDQRKESWVIRKQNLVNALLKTALSETDEIDQTLIAALKDLDSRFAKIPTAAEPAAQKEFLQNIATPEK